MAVINQVPVCCWVITGTAQGAHSILNPILEPQNAAEHLTRVGAHFETSPQSSRWSGVSPQTLRHKANKTKKRERFSVKKTVRPNKDAILWPVHVCTMRFISSTYERHPALNLEAFYF